MSASEPSGALRVDKPVGPTSHDVVDAARRALNIRRVGHTGTLDPFASGLLLLCVGRATRLAEYLTGLDKRYEATAVLGVATDTDDLQGEVVTRSDAGRDVTLDRLEGALAGLRGVQWQRPPRYSAKKVEGVPAHRKVRRGETVELEPREVVVHALELLDFSPPEVRFSVFCSSGTYVRALARDLGEHLGVGAHLTALRRTAIGPHSIEGALGVNELSDADRVRNAWIEPAAAVGHLPRVDLQEPEASAVRLGRPVQTSVADTKAAAAIADGRLVAIGSVEDGVFRPRKVLDV